MLWSSSSTRLSERANRFEEAIYAAEAATEKILSPMDAGFSNQRGTLVYNSLSGYQALDPSPCEQLLDQFQFSAIATGATGRTYCRRNERGDVPGAGLPVRGAQWLRLDVSRAGQRPLA